jgi:hypothetical protein
MTGRIGIDGILRGGFPDENPEINCQLNRYDSADQAISRLLITSITPSVYLAHFSAVFKAL